MRFPSVSITAAAGFALCASLSVSAADLSEVDKLVIAHECEAVLLAYGERIDNGDREGAAALFTEDADFRVRGGPLKGREAIRTAFASQRNPADPTVTLHVFTNVRVEVVGRDHCKLKAYEVIYRYDPVDTEKNTSLAPTLVGKLDDEFIRTKDGWRYAKRHLTAVTLARPAQ